MKQLIKFEFHNLIRTKSLYICMIISMAFSALAVVITKVTGSLLAMDNSASYTAASFLTQAVSGGNLSILLVIFISIFVCTDYIEGTIKNIVSRGITRDQIYIAKYIVLILAGFIFMVVDMLVTFVTAVAFFDVGTFSGKLLGALVIDVVLLVAYVTLYQFFAVLFRKNGATIAVGILFPIALNIVITAFPFILHNYALDLSVIDLSYWFSLLSKSAVTVKEQMGALLCGGLYVAIFGVAGWLVTRKRNL